jgi:hypothetical protein
VSVTRVRDLTSRASLPPFPFLSVFLLAALPTPAQSAESPVTQCASAYESAQLLRQRGKLLAARDEANVCAREQCPEIARRDCARWAEELGREVPSVVVVVRDDADHDVPARRLLVDGALRPEITTGRPLELDPGSHVFRIERPNAAPFERSVTVYQGERDRVLRITAPSPPTTPPAVGVVAAVPSVVPPTTKEAPSYAPAFVVAGFSLVAFGVSGYLGLTGRQELSGLRTSCAPACTDAEVDPVRTRLTLSDVTLGIGLVGTALATYLFIRTASARASPRVRVEVAPVRDGATALLIGRF